LITIPNLAANILSQKPSMYTGMFHYESTIIPLLFFAAVESTDKLFYLLQKKIKPKKTLKKATIILLLLLLSSFVSNFVTTRTPYFTKDKLAKLFSGNLTISDHAKKIKAINKMVEPNASLSTQNNLGPHFASRMNIYIFPNSAHQSDYVLMDFHDPYTGQSYVFPCGTCFHPLSPWEYSHEVEEMFKDKNYGVLLSEDGYILFKRGYTKDANQQSYAQIKNLLITD
jgi:uncharacterized membrane protein